MNTLKFVLALAMVAAIGGCSLMDDQPEELEAALEVAGDVVPANYRDRRDVGCAVGDVSSKFGRFEEGPLAGLEVEYYSSAELDYSRPDWPTQREQSWDALRGRLGVADDAVAVVVVDIRNINGVPHYRYFSNGSWNQLNQNWSSTKVMAELGAIHRLRMQSQGRIGAQSIINDAVLGAQRFSDHTYALHDTSSNASGGLFKHLLGTTAVNGGGLNATSFVRGWLSRPSELFNGYYGYSNYDDYYNILAADGSGAVYLDTSTREITPNHLSPLAMAELWKRLGVNFRDSKLLPSARLGATDASASYGYRSDRDDGTRNAFRGDDAAQWQPTITEDDLMVMFYGSADRDADSVGGMLHDIGIRYRFTSAFGGSAKLDAATGGTWRILGKTGSGDGNSAYGGHLCLPGYKGGRELAFFILGKTPGGVHATSEALGRVIDMFAPGLRTGPALGLIECPAGWQLESIGSDGGTYCSNGTSMYGPFSQSMIAACRSWGGGSACATNNWALEFARTLRGDGLCPRGASYDAETTYCVEGDAAFGPFPSRLIQACEQRGGGSACRTARWSRSFLRNIQRSL